MPCLAAVCQLLGHRATRRPGAWLSAPLVWLALAVLSLASPPVAAQGVEVVELHTLRDESAVSLDYQLRVSLPAGVEGAALRGVPIYFTAQASLWRSRWYWRDERVARVTRQWRLSFQPLTSTWRVSQGGLGQSFGSLPEALSTITRSASWRIAEARDVDPDSRHYVEFDWQLDTTQLPRPMQIGLGGVGGAGEWSLGVERTIRLGTEPGK